MLLDRPRTVLLLELGALALTAAVFVVIPKPPDQSLPMVVFIPTCIGGWGAYGAWRLRTTEGLRAHWGLDLHQGLVPTLRLVLPLLTVSLLGGLGYALATQTPLVPDYLLFSLAMYPLWGLVQQWLIQSLLVDNVRQLTGAPGWALVLLGAVGFGAVHVQFPLLVLATALMGGVYVWMFQRWRNLFPLALCHGWLGSFFYPWVLHQNPTAQMMDLLLGS